MRPCFYTFNQKYPFSAYKWPTLALRPATELEVNVVIS